MNELNPLFSEEPEYATNRLQIFINKIVMYAELKHKMEELEASTTQASDKQINDIQTSIIENNSISS